MPRLTRAQLDQTGCATPNCGHDHTVLFLMGECHPRKGLEVSYDKRTGDLTMKCSHCKRLVATVAVAP